MKNLITLSLSLLTAFACHAQLNVTVSPVKVVGQKAIVPLAFKNNLSEKIESARAAVFLFDEQGKMISQATKWVIEENGNKTGLPAGATNSFFFVVTADKPFLTTNLTAKVTFSRVVLQNGKLADTTKDVVVAMP